MVGLEDDRFLVGFGLFQGRTVKLREGIAYRVIFLLPATFSEHQPEGQHFEVPFFSNKTFTFPPVQYAWENQTIF